MTDNTAVTEATVADLSVWVWEEKYRYTQPDGSSLEKSIHDTHERVCRGVYAKDTGPAEVYDKALKYMDDLVWCPAGRIHAGAGTMKRVTTINCFVSPTIQDSLSEVIPGEVGLPIMKALDIAAQTQQMGGGIGMDFSTLRPELAVIKRTGSMSMGPLPWMAMWDAMCAGIKSAGHRRGAMMAVMRCDHPDIMKFVRAKHVKGVLENFNVSVLVTNDFMKAVFEDTSWDLGFSVPRADGKHVAVTDGDGDKPWYVYERVSAREMWDEIIRSTFEYAEPGIIFIDRVNEWNNLWYCEYLHATNPCGEQPLPDDGDCNLGAINLAKLVFNPFSGIATFDYNRLSQAVEVGVRFLDNVIDTALFPTEAQRIEAFAKRRIGLGVTGLGNMLQMLMIPYGSQAVPILERVWTTIRDTAYRTSIELARERGAFPAFDRDKYCAAKFIQTLPKDIQEGIYKYGIRNAVLLTIAPTGTTSMYYENVSSGVEPTIAWSFTRKAREADGSYKAFKEVSDYGYELFKKVTGHKHGDPLPDYMCSALMAPVVSVEDHLIVQATCQKYIDASISKTINCPKDISFEEFKSVYTRAYDLGLKGVTTYKPSAVRGSVISVEDEKPVKSLPVITVEPRPEELEGNTYKVKYPGVDHAFYVTINDIVGDDGKRRPFEMFINSKSVTHQEWIVALTRMISAIFRRGGDVTFIVEELQQVFSSRGGGFVNKKFVPSIVALIGNVVEKHFMKIGLFGGTLVPPELAPAIIEKLSSYAAEEVLGETCPNCQAPTLFKTEGCDKCTSCMYTSCG